MSIFLLPTSLINTIEKMMNSIWWGYGGSNNSVIHWMSSEKLSMHKNYVGIGFTDLTTFNLATLGNKA